MEPEKTIEVRNLSVAFDGLNILSNVSFSAYKGEVTAILGVSGCGKTTILKHLLGIYPVETGYVSILGSDISQLNEREQIALYEKMGVFYQDGALLNSLTVAENVALPLDQHTSLPKSLIRDIVYMKLSLVNLGHAYHMYPSQLSGGMLKRAALARAIALDPPLLFCDEPGAGLDPVSLSSLDRLILNLKNLLGMTVIMVTHEVLSVMRVADRVIFIDKGAVAFEGSVADALVSDVDSVKNFFAVLETNKSNR